MPNKTIILCTAEGLPTAKHLLNSLQDENFTVCYPIDNSTKGKFRVISIRNGSFVKEYATNVPQHDLAIRWGNRSDWSSVKPIYNQSDALNKASNKSRARKIMLEGSIRCPKMVTPNTILPTQYPVICRPFVHKGGAHFGVLKDFGTFSHQFNRLRGTHYFSEFIDKDSEYRVHCAHGKILGLLKKPAPDDPKQIAWNHALNADAFEVINWNAYSKEMANLALKALASMGMDFGAVDVIVKNGEAYVLEVNSAPSLYSTEYMTDRYVRYFKWLANQTQKREHFKFEEYTKASSFAWKDFNFEDRVPNKLVK
jgi:glutathione synthase/RimK-type ligase-like ATP-grasp enzyme